MKAEKVVRQKSGKQKADPSKNATILIDIWKGSSNKKCKEYTKWNIQQWNRQSHDRPHRY